MLLPCDLQLSNILTCNWHLSLVLILEKSNTDHCILESIKDHRILELATYQCPYLAACNLPIFSFWNVQISNVTILQLITRRCSSFGTCDLITLLYRNLQLNNVPMLQLPTQQRPYLANSSSAIFLSSNLQLSNIPTCNLQYGHIPILQLAMSNVPIFGLVIQQYPSHATSNLAISCNLHLSNFIMLQVNNLPVLQARSQDLFSLAS